MTLHELMADLRAARENADYAEKQREALHGLIGLVQLACARPDMPHEIRQAFADNHRWRDANLAALAKNLPPERCGACDGTGEVFPDSWRHPNDPDNCAVRCQECGGAGHAPEKGSGR